MLSLVEILNPAEEPVNSEVVPLVGLILGQSPAKMIRFHFPIALCDTSTRPNNRCINAKIPDVKQQRKVDIYVLWADQPEHLRVYHVRQQHE